MKAQSFTHIARIGLVLAGTMTLVLSACAGAAPSRSEAGAAVAPAAPEADRGAVADASNSAQLAERLVIRNANLTLIVQDTQAQIEAVTRLATELNGYIASSSTQKYDEGLQARMTLRVPSDQLNVALERLRKMAVEVREEQITGEDVTAEYTDLNARLKNLELAETELRERMDQAEDTEAVLAVFNELTRIRGEIEQIKGRIQFLSQSASLATINVTLIPDQLAQPVQVAGWRPEGVLKSAVEALITALQGLASLAIWLVVVILPIGLLIASPFILLVVLLRRRNRHKPATPPTPPAKTA
jgi:hypothetical protein